MANFMILVIASSVFGIIDAISDARGLSVLLNLKFPLKDVSSYKKEFLALQANKNPSRVPGVFGSFGESVSDVPFRGPGGFGSFGESVIDVSFRVPGGFGSFGESVSDVLFRGPGGFGSFGESVSDVPATKILLATVRIPQPNDNDREVLAIAENKDWDSIINLLNRDGGGNVASAVQPSSEHRPSSNEESQLEKLQRTAIEEGKREFETSQRLLEELGRKNKIIKKDEAAFKHQNVFRKTDPISTQMSRVGTIVGKATEIFKEKNGLSDSSISGLFILGDAKFCNIEFAQQIERPILDTGSLPQRGRPLELLRRGRQLGCNPSDKYRKLDGSCNNLLDADQGAAFTKFRRVLFPDYFGGVFKLRRDANGQPLPSARLISTTINTGNNPQSPELSMLHMTYGQFIDHDLTATPIDAPNRGGPIKCCDPDIIHNSTVSRRLGCAPIKIPNNDPFYSQYNQKCMEFKRSAAARSCTMGPRQQLNQHSAYLDGSGIYGVKSATLNTIREFRGGRMKEHVTATDNSLLVRSFIPDDGCNTPQKMAINEFCFKAGDERVNEQPWLTFFHTVWIREHNRVARILEGKTSWTDDKLFEETRRIIVAELQQVTYKEFLPTILPNSLLTKHEMLPLEGNKQTDSYDKDLDATIANSFAAAAYRFGHSEVGDNLQTVNQDGIAQSHELSTRFFHPFFLYQDEGMSDLARGATRYKARKADPFFTQQIAGKLFRGSHPFGLDLVALNIQRGRDHGIPGYREWLHKCGLTYIDTFNELDFIMTPDKRQALQGVYGHILNDVDLFAGGMSETPVSEGFLGPTFSCLLLDQFLRLKTADRFWYEEKGQAGSFNPDQMTELHKVSLAKIMCNNLPDLKRVQRYPLRNLASDNQLTDCSDIPDYNFLPWACMMEETS